MQHIFAYNGLPWRATAPWLAFLDSSHRADWHVMLRLTVCEIFAVKWRPKTQPPLPLWSRIWRPLKISPPNGQTVSRWQIYHHANFHTDRSHRKMWKKRLSRISGNPAVLSWSCNTWPISIILTCHISKLSQSTLLHHHSDVHAA